MDYFKTEDCLLIQYNHETGVYKYRTDVGIENKVIPKDEFLKLNAKKINKLKFCTLMNLYFKNVKHSWKFDYSNYRKLDNFEIDKFNSCTNYDIYNEVSRHDLTPEKEYSYLKNLMLVYHWGKVYYFNWSYNGYPQGQLFDVNTHQVVRWANPKNCAPIFNETKRKIC